MRDFAAIEDQFAAADDPGGDIARARMALVYGQEAAGAFFALLDDTLVVDVRLYPSGAGHSRPRSPPPTPESLTTTSSTASPMRAFSAAAQRDTLQAVAGVSAAFQAAVDALFARSQDALGSFFARYPELKPLYDTYIASIDPPATRRAALLAAFRPDCSRRRKRQQALQRLSATAAVDPSFAQALLLIRPPPPLIRCMPPDTRPAGAQRRARAGDTGPGGAVLLPRHGDRRRRPDRARRREPGLFRRRQPSASEPNVRCGDIRHLERASWRRRRAGSTTSSSRQTPRQSLPWRSAARPAR